MPDLKEEVAALAMPSVELFLEKSESESFSEISGCFGGIPYMQPDERWPTCSACASPLDFVCQLSIEKIDIRFNFITFFYCWECNPLGTEKEKKGMWQARLYKKVDKKNWLPQANPAEPVTLPCRLHYRDVTSFPDFSGLSVLHPEIFRNFDTEDGAEQYENIIEELTELEGYTFTGGYPQFIEFADFPACTECQGRMQLLLQIDSEEEADLIWGRSGCAYLFYCKLRPRKLQLRVQF